MPFSRLSFLWSLLLAAIVGCTPPPPAPNSLPPPEPSTGSVWLAVSIPQSPSDFPVVRVTVMVSAADMPSVEIGLNKSNGVWVGRRDGLPAGARLTFTARAYNTVHEPVVFQGEASGVELSADQLTAVVLTLQGMPPYYPPPITRSPTIDSLVASAASVQTGTSHSLTALPTSRNPDADGRLSLAWTATAGAFSAPSSALTSWTAPATAGRQTLTLTATDSQGLVTTLSLVLHVVEGAEDKATPDVSFNVWPKVSRLSVNKTPVGAGRSTTVSVFAADADHDPLSYAWTASCPGTWTNASSATALFVPSSVPSGACDNCEATVTVRDGRGGQRTGSLALCVAHPPRITHSAQSAASAAAGQTVTFDVSALDTQSSALTFSWIATTGVLAPPASSASASQAMWTAPACAVEGTTPGITATVSNALGLTATQTFEVTGLPRCATGWAAARPMRDQRVGHTATLLRDGRVLLTGGTSRGAALATAEVYDPATDTWSETGAMSTKRQSHAAVLLQDGKVLVSGGLYQSSAEVYDPATGTWSTTGAMVQGRLLHKVTLLRDGRVLVVGGHEARTPIQTAEVYDPAAGLWSKTGSMSTRRIEHTVTRLRDGKVLVTGGREVPDTLQTAEVYDPATDLWSATASMSTPRSAHEAMLLPDGRVLATGGLSPLSSELYDPATGTWSGANSLPVQGVTRTVTLLSNGKVLLTGRYTGSAGGEQSAYLHDPATASWVATEDTPIERELYTATLLLNGKVLVVGGLIKSNYLTDAYVYTP